jgi:hypothetical protein
MIPFHHTRSGGLALFYGHLEVKDGFNDLSSFGSIGAVNRAFHAGTVPNADLISLLIYCIQYLRHQRTSSSSPELGKFCCTRLNQ